jgi:hypothetical protein
MAWSFARYLVPPVSDTLQPTISFGAGGSPNTNLTEPKGSLHIVRDGTADAILYVNTDGATAWSNTDVGAMAISNLTLPTGEMIVGAAGVGSGIDIGGTAQGLPLSDGIGGVTVGTLQNGTASVTEGAPSEFKREVFTNPAAAGTNVIAQIAGGADIDESTWGNITQLDVMRTIQVDASAAWDGGDIGVTALWSDGTFGEKTLTATPGSVVESAFAAMVGTITRARNLAASSAGTCDIQAGPKLGLMLNGKTLGTALVVETSTNGLDGGAAVDANGVVTTSAAPNGALDWTIFYTISNTYTDAGHAHTIA